MGFGGPPAALLQKDFAEKSLRPVVEGHAGNGIPQIRRGVP